MPKEEICKNTKVIEMLSQAVEEWTEKIKKVILDSEKDEKTDLASTNSLGWIDYWRARAAKYNTLYQQLTMPKVKEILGIMKDSNESESYSLSNWDNEMVKFTKKYSEAQDFVKFLSTLER